MVRKRKTTQYQKFKKLKNRKKTPKYASLRKSYTVEPEKIMDKVWARMGKSLDQRMLHDVYKIIDEFLLEKLIYDDVFELEGFGTLQVIEQPYAEAASKKRLIVKFIPDSKLKDKIKLLQKEE